MSCLLASVRTTISRHELLKKGDRYLVALSGGADSVALLLVLKRQGYDIEAAHCNFRLRGEESKRDERFCISLCQRLNIKLHIQHFDTVAEAQTHGESIEMAARRLRYDWFDRLCAERHCEAVCTGHHSDDNVETMLLNLCRGTGIHGLTGMAYRRDNIIRPLLDVRRTEVLDFLEEEGQDYITDSSNADTRFKRNLVRHELLPLLRRLNPSIEQTLLGNMEKLRAAEEVYDGIGKQAVETLAEPLPHGVAYNLRSLQYAAAFDAIGRTFCFSADTMRAIRQVEDESCRALFESPTHIACIYRGRLEVSPQPYDFVPLRLEADEQYDLPDGGRLCLRLMERDALKEIPREPERVALDYDKVCGALTYRRIKQGDRFRPFGLQGTKLVSDFLTDCRFSQVSRLWACVLCDEQGILWLAGQRPDHRATITSQTHRVLYVERINS